MKAPVVTETTISKSQITEIEYVENNMKKINGKREQSHRDNKIYSGSAILPTSTPKLILLFNNRIQKSFVDDWFDYKIALV